MAKSKLDGMPLTELVILCIAKRIPYKGLNAEALRAKLGKKEAAPVTS